MDGSLVTVFAAVEAAVSLTSSQKDRNKAYQFCEEFKRTCPDLWNVGVTLISHHSLSIPVRLFGAQLAQHAVDHRLVDVSDDTKVSWQQTALHLMSMSYESDTTALRNGVVCVVADLVKRTWPQQWVDLMASLTAISQLGNEQLESVLLLFGRLGEDVSGFDRSLHHKRKQELVYSLHQYMPDLFNFIVSTVQQQLMLPSQNASLTQITLNTLCVYLEWAELSCVFAQDGVILNLLTRLLTVETHRMLAADCLLTIVQRKGKVIDQIPVLRLFEEDVVCAFFEAASGSSSVSVEDNYMFVKKLCKVMATLGTSQLCVLWGNPKEPGLGRPDNFLNYLQAMLKFLQHPSQDLNFLSAQLWLAFLKHEHISKDEQFQYLLPDVVTEAAAKLIRVGDLSWDTSAVGDYARMDFEEAEEFVSFFGKLRHTLMAVIRLATLIMPTAVHDLATAQLVQLLTSETDKLPQNHSNEQPSSVVLAWDRLSCFLDSVIPTLFKSDSQPDHAVFQSGCSCIEQLLSSFSDNPSVLSYQLSCLHSLCPYIRVFPSLVFPVIKKLLSVVEFKQQQESKAVISLRRHACALVISLSREYSDVLVTFFDELCQHVILLSQKHAISYTEIAMLVEAIMTMSKYVEDSSKRITFFKEALSPVQSVLMSEGMGRALASSPIDVLKYFGLCNDPHQCDTNEDSRSLQKQVVYGLKLLLAALKQSHVVSVSTSPPGADDSNQSVLVGNSFSSLLLTFVERVTIIARALTAFWLPEVMATIHPDYRNVLDLAEHDKLMVLGLPTSSLEQEVSRDVCYRVHCELFSMFELVYTCIGAAGESLCPPFQLSPNAAQHLLATAVCNLPCVPNYHIRILLKSALTGLIVHCPPDVFRPFLNVFLPPIVNFMLERLTADWEKMKTRQSGNAVHEDGKEEKQTQEEVVNDRLLFSLTRDYIRFLSDCLYKKPVDLHKDDFSTDEQSMDVNMLDVSTEDSRLSGLGKHIMSLDEARQPVLFALFSCLTWLDTQSTVKAARVISSVCLEALSSTSSDEVAAQLFTIVLQALQLHGQQPNCFNALLQLVLKLYQLWGKRHLVIAVLKTVPGVGEWELQSLEKCCIEKEVNDKERRQQIRQFKEILAPIVGKSVSEAFPMFPKSVLHLPELLKSQNQQGGETLTDCNLTSLFDDKRYIQRLNCKVQWSNSLLGRHWD